MSCALCLTAPAPKTGCACTERRAHVECLTTAKHDSMWYMCPVCSQEYTGAMRMALAVEWVRRTRASGSDVERMRAMSHHAYAVGCDGRYDESERELGLCIEETRRRLGSAHRLVNEDAFKDADSDGVVFQAAGVAEPFVGDGNELQGRAAVEHRHALRRYGRVLRKRRQW